LDGVNLSNVFFTANRFDARKTESQPAGVTLARLNRIESDLQNYFGSNLPIMARLADRGAQEVFGKLFDFFVAEAGISLANSLEVTGLFVAD
jgi:hypothetical protein